MGGKRCSNRVIVKVPDVTRYLNFITRKKNLFLGGFGELYNLKIYFTKDFSGDYLLFGLGERVLYGVVLASLASN